MRSLLKELLMACRYAEEMTSVDVSPLSCHQPGLSLPISPEHLWDASVGWILENTDLLS